MILGPGKPKYPHDSPELSAAQLLKFALISHHRCISLHSSSKLSRLKLSAAAPLEPHLLSGRNYVSVFEYRISYRAEGCGWDWDLGLPSIAMAFHRHHYGHAEKPGQDVWVSPFDIRVGVLGCTSTSISQSVLVPLSLEEWLKLRRMNWIELNRTAWRRWSWLPFTIEHSTKIESKLGLELSKNKYDGSSGI